MSSEVLPTVDLNIICRLCLSEEKEMRDIFKEERGEVPLPLRIMSCTSIEITRTDKLPNHICGVCLDQIDVWYKFKDHCEHADRSLRKLVGDDAIDYRDIDKLRENGRALREMFHHPIKEQKVATPEPAKKIEEGEIEETRVRAKVKFVECFRCSQFVNANAIEAHNRSVHGKKRRRIHQRKEPVPMPKLRTLIKIINGGSKEPEIEIDSKRKKLEEDDTCTLCGAEFINYSEIVEHMLVEHENELSESQKRELNKNFSTEKTEDHFDTFLDLNADDPVDDTPPQFCNECDQKFVNESELLIHKYYNHNNKRRNPELMQCPDCVLQFKSSKLLYEHIRDQHWHRCSDCNDGFSTAEDLERHILELGEHKERFFCSDCGLAFDDKNQLKEHMRQKTQCDICNKVLSRPQRLIEHKLIKHGIGEKKEYICDECGKTFPYATSLRYHKRIHGEKSIFCNKCGKSFHFLCNYNVHVDLHHSKVEDKVVCELCGGLFPKCKMRDHLARHSKPSLQCNLCPKLFRLKNQLKRHKTQYHKETPYSCPYCPKGFIKKENLEAHIQRVHNIVFKFQI